MSSLDLSFLSLLFRIMGVVVRLRVYLFDLLQAGGIEEWCP
jgi:hypothetical protein